jgi:hypothetical protein
LSTDNRSARPVLIVFYAIALTGVATILVLGLDYYRTPLLERGHHPGYWTWKPSGSVGHKLGLIGSSMMVLMLLYSVRKRVGALRRMGPLSRWLDAHIFLGVVGPLLVILHTTFKVQGLVALSFWSMIVVVASGVLGRYLYLQIPRTRAGEALALEDLERQDRELSERLRTRFGLDPEHLAALDAATVTASGRVGLLRGLLLIVADDVRLRARLREFARHGPSVPRPLLGEFGRTLRQKALARRRLLLWGRLHELFHYWHVLHKPFALVMYLFMFVHVAVAVATGYGWSGLR